MNSLFYTPVVPWPWICALACVTLVLACWSALYGLRSRGRTIALLILRALALAALVFMLGQPRSKVYETDRVRSQVALLVDTSESMVDRADPAQPTRAERVAEWLERSGARDAGDLFRLRTFRFDRDLSELPEGSGAFEFAGARSDVASAIARLQDRFRGQPLAAIFLLSDGLETVRDTGLPAAGGVPVYAFALEEPFEGGAPRKRVSLAGLDFPPRIMTGWEAQIRAEYRGEGMKGESVVVELWGGETKRDEAPVAFGEDGQARPVTFAVTPDRAGTVEYQLRVSDEVADDTARVRPVVIEVIEPGTRILYIQGALGFEFKFLRKVLGAERNLDLHAYVRWGDGRLVRLGQGASDAGAAPLDLRPEALAPYSVVILGDLSPDALPADRWEAVRGFVDRGGGLVILGGREAFAHPERAPPVYAGLLPFRLPAEYRQGTFPVSITDAGLRHPVFGPLFASVREFAPLLTCNAVAGTGAASEVLLETGAGDGARPLVISSRFGKGRVVCLLSDTLWRWRLAARGWKGEETPYDTFWAQLVDWLIPKTGEPAEGGALDLYTGRTEFTFGERPEVRAILRRPPGAEGPPATLALEIRTPEEKVFHYDMRPAKLEIRGGRQVDGYRAEVEPGGVGVFVASARATVGGAAVGGETRFLVGRPQTERTGRAIDRERLGRIAEASGGRFYEVSDWAAWRGDFRPAADEFTRLRLSELWNSPYLLGFLMVLLAVEWAHRKFWNLP